MSFEQWVRDFVAMMDNEASGIHQELRALKYSSDKCYDSEELEGIGLEELAELAERARVLRDRWVTYAAQVAYVHTVMNTFLMSMGDAPAELDWIERALEVGEERK